MADRAGEVVEDGAGDPLPDGTERGRRIQADPPLARLAMQVDGQVHVGEQPFVRSFMRSGAVGDVDERDVRGERGRDLASTRSRGPVTHAMARPGFGGLPSRTSSEATNPPGQAELIAQGASVSGPASGSGPPPATVVVSTSARSYCSSTAPGSA
jgi:hypothetical protein